MDKTNPDDGIRIGHIHVSQYRNMRGFALRSVMGGEIVLYHADLPELMRFIVDHSNRADVDRIVDAMNEARAIDK